jgi:hypothetical protein
VSVTKPAVIVGQRTVVRGRVTPAKASTRVALQQRVTGGWKNLSQQRVGAKGSYRFGVAPRTAGTLRYRVIRLPWRPSGTVSSRTVAVTSYRWIDVTTTVTNWVTWENASAYGDPATIDGVTYPGSIVLDPTAEAQGGWVEIDLAGRRCAGLETTIGALDDNAPGSEVDTEISFDGGLIRQDTYAVGEADHLVLDVRDVRELRVSATVVDNGPEAYLGIGAPRLLCAT